MVWQRFFHHREPFWQDTEGLLQRAKRSIQDLNSQDLRTLALSYRAVMTDLSRAQSDPRYHHLVPYLNNLAQRIHTQVHHSPPSDWRDLIRFVTVKFPQAVWRRKHWIILSTLLFVLGTLLAFWMVWGDPETYRYFMGDDTIQGLKEGKLWMSGETGAPHQSAFLMANNIRVALYAFASGLLMGIGSVILLFFNGMFAFGGPLAITFQYGLGYKLLMFVAAHGPIELTTIFISGGAGMTIGFSILFPGNLPRWEAVRRNSKDAFILALGCIPLLVIAGIIEGMLSLNEATPDFLRIATGLITGVVLYAYLIFWSWYQHSRQS